MTLRRWAGFDPLERNMGEDHPLFGRPCAPLTKALISSRAARNRVRAMKEEARRFPPVAATGGFPYPARTCAELPRRGRPE